MDRIRDYIEQIFSNYAPTQERVDLKEEILQNCRDRYDEYIAQGMSEEKAEQKVIASIGNLDDLLASMAQDGGSDSILPALKKRVQKAETSHDDEESSHPYSSEIHRVVIKVGARDVNLIGTDEDDIVVECDDSIHQQADGDTLRIDENTMRHGTFAGFMGVFDDLDDLTVYVPHGIASIEVSTTAGDLELKRLDVERFRFHSASGDVSGSLDYCGTLEMDTNASDVDLEGTAENVAIRSVAGDVDLDLSGMKRADFNLKAGDLDLKLHDPFDDLHVTTISGDADIDVRDLEGVDIVSSASHSGSISVDANILRGINPITIHTVSGDVTIEG